MCVMQGCKVVLILIFFVFQGCGSTSKVQSARSGLLESLGDPWSGVVGHHTGKKRSLVIADSNEKTFASMRRVQELRNQTKNWYWPLTQIRVTSPFGDRDDALHEGVDLQAKIGTPVYAVQKGKVIYASHRLSGYGKMVVIRHAQGLSSVYAHNKELLVRPGQWITQGDMIALSGNTGKTSGPHLHFEVRDGKMPIDPTRLLGDRVARIKEELPVRTLAKAKKQPSYQSGRRKGLLAYRNEKVEVSAAAPLRAPAKNNTKSKKKNSNK